MFVIQSYRYSRFVDWQCTGCSRLSEKMCKTFWGYLSVLFSSFVFVLELKNRYAQETKCLLNKINDYSSKSMLYKKKKENHVNIICMRFFFFLVNYYIWVVGSS